jgi:hypothetical protein
MIAKTPWGPAQNQNNYDLGVIAVSTSSHGGIGVPLAVARKIPAAFKRVAFVQKDSDYYWFEEDCCAYIPLYFLAEAMGEERNREFFGRQIKSLYPDLAHLV